MMTQSHSKPATQTRLRRTALALVTLWGLSPMAVSHASLAETSPQDMVVSSTVSVLGLNSELEQNTQQTAERHELLVIDAAVADAQTLLKGLSPDVEVLMLGEGEGLERIAAVLEGRDGLDAIHLISHGEPGRLLLGGTRVDQVSLQTYRDELTGIGAALADDGDLLLYGCNVAKGGEGDAFVADLARVTGADVAASSNLTGAKSLGGNWLLESNTGFIGSNPVLSQVDMDAYEKTLVPVVIGNNGEIIDSTSSVNGFVAGQTFTATKTGVLTDIQIAQDANSLGGSVTLKVYSGAGTGGALLHTQTVGPIPDTITTASFYTLTTFTLSATVNITDGSVYTFEFTPAPDTDLAYTLSTDTYVSGDISADGILYSGNDLIFQVTQGDLPNTAPSITGTVLAQPVTDITTLSPFSGVTIADGDADNVTVQVTLDTAAKGTFSTLNGFTAAGGGVYTLASGTAAAATTAIRGMVYNPADNRVAPTTTETSTFSIAVNDGAVITNSINTTTVVSTSVNDAPTLADTALSLTAVDEDAIAPVGAVGTLVSALMGGIADVDTGAVKGIALTATDTTNGSWYYSLNGGTNWTAVGAVSGTSALLLASDAGTRLYFDPTTLNYNGAIASAITMRAWDQTSGAAGGKVDVSTNGTTTAFSTATDVASLTVNAVNDIPTLTSFASTLATTNEDTEATITFANLNTQGDEADVDGTVDAYVVQVVSTGTLKIGATAGGAGAYAAGSNDTIDSSNNAYWTPALNANGTLDAFTVKAKDNLAALSATEVLAQVVVNAVNDAPTLGGITTVTNINDTATATPFSGFTVADVDSPAQSQSVSVTLDTAAKGALSNLGGGAYNAATGVYSFTGTAAATQTAIRGLIFTPTSNRVASGLTEITTFTVSVNDGVAAAVTNNATTVVSTSVNDAPVITGASAGQAVNDNATVSPFSGVTIGDADSPAQTQAVSVTLDTAAKGALSNLGGGAYNAGTGVYSFTGTAAAATTAINGLVFTPTDDRVNPTLTETTTFTISVDDGVIGAPVTNNATTVITTAVNDAPSIGGAIAVTNIIDTATATPFSAFTVADADTNQSQSVSVTLDTAAKGALSSLGGGAYNAGTGIYNFTGTAAAAQTAIRGLVFTPTANRVTPTTTEITIFTVSVDDGIATAVTNSLTTVVSTSVNDAPTLGGITTVTNINDTATATPFSAFTVADVDSPAQSQTVSVTLDDAAKGSFTTLNGFTNGGGGIYNFTGTAAATQAAIRGLVYTPTSNRVASGLTETTTFTVSVYDGVAVAVTDNTTTVVSTSVNDAPVISGVPSTLTPVDTVLFSFTPTVNDIDPNATFTYSIDNTPSWATFDTNTGELRGTPVFSDIGEVTDIIITVSDGLLSDSLPVFTLTVNQNNTAPTISGPADPEVGENTNYSFVPTSNDIDNDTLLFSITNKPIWATFDTATGGLSGVPGNANIGSHNNIVINVDDGLLNVDLAAFAILVFADLDSDDISDATDPDIDGDGMLNTYENANGLDSWNAADRDTDLDGDGVSNYDESVAGTNADLDDYPPVVTPPADINLDAVGLFTPVTTGSASATDAKDGAITPTSDAPTHFAPGINTVTWSSTDAVGNTGTAEQLVNVNPQVNFSKDQTTSEDSGSTTTFSVILNGPAVSYPVTVPYTVGGSATSVSNEDYNPLNGSITINSGTSTAEAITIVDDGAGEGTENIIITMGTPTNAVAGSNSEHTIDIVEGNVAPTVTLGAEQDGLAAVITPVDDGLVTVLGSVVDPNTGNTHTYDWSATDNALVDNDGDAVNDTFIFDPSTLAPGLYTLRLSVSDGSASNSAAITLNVVASPPVLTSADSDGDGIDDQTEGYGDSDGDGVADYLDAIDSSNVLQEQSGESRRFLSETEPGLSLSLNNIAVQAGNGQAEVSMTDIINGGGSGDDATYYDYFSGLFDITVFGLPVAGQSVMVVQAQFAPVPANAVYRKPVSGGWQAFVIDDNNLVSSAPGEAGYCPPPGDSAYLSGLGEGHWCVQLTIEDGGPNDADGIANNSIVDPGGVAQILATDVNISVTSGGGGVAPLWLLLMGLLGLPRLLASRKGRVGQ